MSDVAETMAIRKPQPASPLRWLADVFLPLVGAGKLIQNDAREFLVRSIETNSARVQNDILNRVQESRGSLEVEIRKLLHEVNRIAGEALVRARKVKGEPAVEAELQRLEALETEISGLAQSARSSKCMTADEGSGGPAGAALRSKRLRKPSLQEFSQFRCCLELGNRLQFLERRRERVRKTPNRPGSKLLILRLEVLCCRQHKHTYVAQRFMWRLPRMRARAHRLA